MGHRSDQRQLFAADSQYLEFVGRESFYGFLAMHGRELFRDEDFAEFYCHTVGRTSVAPSLLMTALVLQAHDDVSDAEAKARADFDLRWKVALGVGVDDRPFAKSTLQEFRAQLVIHDRAGSVLVRSLEYARAHGYLKKHKIRAALDTTLILGRGAVKDTYNLIGDGIRLLARALASVEELAAEAWAAREGYERYFASSLKGASEVDWEDAGSRESFLTSILADGERLLALARETRERLEAESAEDARIAEAASLLTRLLWQDVEPSERGGWKIKKGTAKDRVPSAHDPEQRHGHKSRNRSFTGHKASVAVDVETGLVLEADVIGGNEPDGARASELVEAAESNAAVEVEQVIGDTAYGSMETRASLGEREVIAPTVKPHTKRLPKDAFEIDVEGDVVRCPAGHETREWRWRSAGKDASGEPIRVKAYAFPTKLCRACPRREECIGPGPRRRGRRIQLHPQEAKLQAARALERTEYFGEQYHDRVIVEHRIARMVQLGIRQARYFGRTKTRFQVLLAAAVANLTRVMGAEATDTDGTDDTKPSTRSHRLLTTLLEALRTLREAFRAPAALQPLFRLSHHPTPLHNITCATIPRFRPGF